LARHDSPEFSSGGDAAGSPQAGPPAHDESGQAGPPRALLFSGLRTVSLLTLSSRVLGMARDMGMAALFGNGPVMDAFSVAFRIPNLARRLFGEGALSTAFLPSFIHERETAGVGASEKLASGVFVVLACVLGVLVVAGELALGIALAFFEFGPEADLLLRLTAVMLPYLVFICLVAQISAVMHGLRHFTWPALEPVLLNVLWIACLAWAAIGLESKTAQVYLIAFGVVLAGVVQLVAPLPKLRRLGFHFDRDWRAAAPQVRKIAWAMVPVVIGLSIEQLNTFCDSLIAWGFSQPASGPAPISWLPGGPEYPLETGTASALYFGQRVYQFPLGVFGVALSTVMFPLLSQHAGQGRMDRLRDDFALGLRLVFYIGIPASVGLICLAGPLADLLFRRGEFTRENSLQTAGMIWAYGCGVWAYCGVLILQRGYYAVGDRMTPLRIGLFGIVFDLALNLTLIWPMGGIGLALSTAISAIVQFSLIAWLVQERVGRLDWESLRRAAGRAGIASAAMSAACLAARWMFPGGDGLAANGMAVLVPFAAALIVYFSIARWLDMSEMWLLFWRDKQR